MPGLADAGEHTEKMKKVKNEKAVGEEYLQ